MHRFLSQYAWYRRLRGGRWHKYLAPNMRRLVRYMDDTPQIHWVRTIENLPEARLKS